MPPARSLELQARVAVVLVAGTAGVGLQAVGIGDLTRRPASSSHSLEFIHISARRLSGPPFGLPFSSNGCGSDGRRAEVHRDAPSSPPLAHLAPVGRRPLPRRRRRR